MSHPVAPHRQDSIFTEHNDYPQSMRARLGSRLPTFSESERASLKGSADFFGMNFYTSYFIKELSADAETVGT